MRRLFGKSCAVHGSRGARDFSSSMADAKPMWLDCDPGHDDALAIILAGHSSSIDLLGISTVAGNQSVDKTTLNAAKVLAVSGIRNIKVYKGQAGPLLPRTKIHGDDHDPEIHGECGLGGSIISAWTEDKVNSIDDAILSESKTKGVLAMAAALMDAPEPVAVVATGALTNVALCLKLFPEVKEKISVISFMGGALGLGNRSPVAEFNILCDPEAAQIVVDSGLPVIMVPLEVTHTALATDSVLERIRAMDSQYADMVVDLLTFFKQTYLVSGLRVQAVPK